MTTPPRSGAAGTTYSIIIHRPSNLEFDSHVSLVEQKWAPGARVAVPDLSSREYVPDIEIRSTVQRMLNTIGLPSLQEQSPLF